MPRWIAQARSCIPRSTRKSSTVGLPGAPVASDSAPAFAGVTNGAEPRLHGYSIVFPPDVVHFAAATRLVHQNQA